MGDDNENSIALRKENAVVSTQDFDQQVELAKEIMMRQAKAYGTKNISTPESYASKFEIVKHEDGTITATPREKPFKNLPEEKKGINLMIRSPYSDRIGLDAEKRGKYRDEDRLNFNEYGTVEMGEVQAVGSIA